MLKNKLSIRALFQVALFAPIFVYAQSNGNSKVVNIVESPKSIQVTQIFKSGENHQVYSEEVIVVENKVESGAYADYTAGKTIVLSTGFSVKKGATASANIGDGMGEEPTRSINGLISFTEELQDVSSIGNEIDGESVADVSSEFSIYPNPSKGVFYVSGLQVGNKVSVLDTHGTLIKTNKATSGIMKFDISLYPEGVYYIQIVSGLEVATKKIIIEK